MIDQDTYQRVLEARKKAQTLGLDFTEVLDRFGLLLTIQRERDLQTDVLEDLLRRLDRQSASKLMMYWHKRTDGTPAEMFEAVCGWLETLIRKYADGTLEDL